MDSRDFFIEQYVLGELDQEGERRLIESFSDMEEFNRRIEAVRKSDSEILQKYRSAETADSIKKRLEGHSGGSGHAASAAGRVLPFGKVFFGSGIAAAAVLAFVIGLSIIGMPLSTGGTEAYAGAEPGVRIKGLKPVMHIFRQIEDSAEILENRDTVYENDLLQIEYLAGDYEYGVIFSIDDRGTVTLHYPSFAGIDARLEKNGAVLLPYSYQLDDSPEFERFFFVLGRDGFDREEVLDAAYELARSGAASRRRFLDIPESYYQTTILLKKGK